MNADARTDELPPAALARSPFGKPWVPLEWHRDAPAVLKLDDERSLSDPDPLGRRRFRCWT